MKISMLLITRDGAPAMPETVFDVEKEGDEPPVTIIHKGVAYNLETWTPSTECDFAEYHEAHQFTVPTAGMEINLPPICIPDLAYNDKITPSEKIVRACSDTLGIVNSAMLKARTGLSFSFEVGNVDNVVTYFHTKVLVNEKPAN